MKNIDKSNIDKISAGSALMYTSFLDSDKWIENNLLYEDRELLSVKVKRSRSEIAKISEHIESKPVFALYGISQVGKSYLAQSLLSMDGKPLEVICGDNKVDFLKKINPQGNGAESTGVVTRFTIDKLGVSNDFPVKVKMLTPKDVIIILADSFFSDVSRLENYTSREDFKLRIKELKKKYEDKPIIQNFLSEDDIWDTSKYFKQNFHKFSHYIDEIESSGYWYEVGNLISKIPIEEWSSLFEVIWFSNTKLTALFNKLIDSMQGLDFSKTIYVSEGTILRDEGAILDVQQLNNMLKNSPIVSVALSKGKQRKIPISLLSALTSELIFSVDSELAEKKPFLKNTDLLDFPGARSRESFAIEEITEEAIVKMYLRGKISYLFNKYSSDFEINNLLFCMKDEKVEVNELAGILNDWIEKNIGYDAETRENTIGSLPTSPLFVILTFFNRQLDLDPVNDDTIEGVNKKWDNRFRRFFEEQITFKYGWHTNWTNSKPNFSNFYFLRDQKFSKDMFKSEAGIETIIKPDRESHWNNLKSTFLKYPFVKKHFSSPEKTWDMSATPRNDGSQMITDALEPAANNYVKIKNFSDRLDKMKNELIIDLKKHFVSDDITEKRDQAFHKANDIQFELLNLFNSPEFKFAHFLKSFSLVDTEVYNIIHEDFLRASRSNEPKQFVIFRAMFPELSGSLSRNENLKIIAGKLKLKGPDEAESYLDTKNIDLNAALENRVYTSATILVDGVIKLWESKMTIENFDKFLQIGFTKKTLLEMKTNLLETFESLHVREVLIDIFEQKTRLLNSSSETEEYLSAISANYINDFVSNFGFNFMNSERKIELFELCELYNEDVNLIKNVKIENHEAKLKLIYDSIGTRESTESPLIENFRIYILKMKMAMISNCGFANYNVDSNDELQSIIENLESLEFSIDK